MITAVIISWVAVGLFLVALPLFAWWLGGRRFLSRPSGDVEATALGRTVAQRHGLRPAQAALVQRAVTWGRALDEPELRAAAVDWAQQLVELRRRRRAARRQLRGWLVVVLILWLTFILARVSFAVAPGAVERRELVHHGLLCRRRPRWLAAAHRPWPGDRAEQRPAGLNRRDRSCAVAAPRAGATAHEHGATVGSAAQRE